MEADSYLNLSRNFVVKTLTPSRFNRKAPLLVSLVLHRVLSRPSLLTQEPIYIWDTVCGSMFPRNRRHLSVN